MDEVFQLLAPGECTVDAASGLVLVKAPATPDMSHVAVVVERVLALCDQHSVAGLLMDFRGWDASRLTSRHMAQMRGITSCIGPLGEGFKAAVLVDTDLAYGLGRMYATRDAGEGRELGVFRDGDDALGWLRVRGDQASTG
jgi:hypothetical protein